MTTLLKKLCLATVGAVAGAALWFRLPYSPLKKTFVDDVALAKARQPEMTGAFTRQDLENLPELLQRYLIHCGYLDMPKMRWMTMRYEDVEFLQNVKFFLFRLTNIYA